MGESLLVMLIIGAVAGWLAGRIVEGYGFGMLGNIVGVGGGVVQAFIHSTLGAVILLVLIRLVKRA